MQWLQRLQDTLPQQPNLLLHQHSQPAAVWLCRRDVCGLAHAGKHANGHISCCDQQQALTRSAMVLAAGRCIAGGCCSVVASHLLGGWGLIT